MERAIKLMAKFDFDKTRLEAFLKLLASNKQLEDARLLHEKQVEDFKPKCVTPIVHKILQKLREGSGTIKLASALKDDISKFVTDALTTDANDFIESNTAFFLLSPAEIEAAGFKNRNELVEGFNDACNGFAKISTGLGMTDDRVKFFFMIDAN